jgi:hypothetical protein
MQLNTSNTSQHSGKRIRKIMINTDVDVDQHVRHSSTLRTEDKELDTDQHRLRRIPTRQIQLNTQDRG